MAVDGIGAIFEQAWKMIGELQADVEMTCGSGSGSDDGSTIMPPLTRCWKPQGKCS